MEADRVLNGAAFTSASSRGQGVPAVAKVAIVLEVLLGIAAIGGGWGLMNPASDGSALGMPVEWLRGTPFASWLIPGLLLFGVFGVGSLVAALAGLLRHWSAPYLAFAVGLGQVIWIVVEAILLRHVGFHPLQPTMLIWGGLIAALAYFWWRRAPQRVG